MSPGVHAPIQRVTGPPLVTTDPLEPSTREIHRAHQHIVGWTAEQTLVAGVDRCQIGDRDAGENMIDLHR